ncbi:MAG: VOC family protein [Candidatus Limnocylindrales bacterium]
MARVVHFEITADDPERAGRFYQQALGWTVQKYGGPFDYWLAGTGPDTSAGIDGAIMSRAKPGENAVLSVSVEKLEAAIEAVRKAGGTVAGEIQDIPGVGRFIYATDTEGNRLGLLEALPRTA